MQNVDSQYKDGSKFNTIILDNLNKMFVEQFTHFLNTSFRKSRYNHQQTQHFYLKKFYLSTTLYLEEYLPQMVSFADIHQHYDLMNQILNDLAPETINLDINAKIYDEIERKVDKHLLKRFMRAKHPEDEPYFQIRQNFVYSYAMSQFMSFFVGIVCSCGNKCILRTS